MLNVDLDLLAVRFGLSILHLPEHFFSAFLRSIIPPYLQLNSIAHEQLQEVAQAIIRPLLCGKGERYVAG